MAWTHVRGSGPGVYLVAAWIAVVACKPSPGPAIQVVGDSTRIRLEDPVPAHSPWFDGAKLTLVAARGETLGIQVLHREPAAVSLRFSDPAVSVRGYAVEAFRALGRSTEMYGGTRGPGTYPDALTPADAPTTHPAFFDIVVAPGAAPGTRTGELIVGERTFPATIEIAPVTLPPLPPYVWAYGDPRELVWAIDPSGDPPRATPSATELACIDTFRAYGVLLSPDVHLDWWEHRKHLLAGLPDIPVNISDDPAIAREQVRRWIELTEGTGQVPFAIPIDEPRTPEQRAKVKALAQAVRDAGGGPGRFHYAVTDVPREEYGDLIDLYISMSAAHLEGDRHRRWTYNGGHPFAGSMVLDAITPGTRTWGWIAWRYKIATWYVWDALYWHDRHNRGNAPLPGRALDPRADPVSFNDGEDRGNLDGVLALPARGGCQPTLRLAQIRRGMQDRQLLDLAARCAPEATEKLAAKMMPKALADAAGSGKPSGKQPSWPITEPPWEEARRKLLDLAACEATKP